MRPKFCLQKTETASREQLAVVNSASMLDATYRFGAVCEPDEIPIGDVQFCERVFGTQPRIKQMYPEFLADLFRRRITMCDGHGIADQGVFAKSAIEWKASFSAAIYKPGDEMPDGPLWASDVVSFVDEWRYYVANGIVVASGWYQGQNEDAPAPAITGSGRANEIKIDWPDGFSGAVDFGRLDTGELALVEAHAPMACGWYGDSKHAHWYVAWQKLAWENRGFWLEKL